RDQDVRALLPLHARSDGSAGAQAAHAPAGDRRSESRRGASRPRHAAVASGRGGGGGRADRGGPPAARRGDLRRSTVASGERARGLRGAGPRGGGPPRKVAVTDARARASGRVNVPLTPSSTADSVRDQRIERVESLAAPDRLLAELPLS